MTSVSTPALRPGPAFSAVGLGAFFLAAALIFADRLANTGPLIVLSLGFALVTVGVFSLWDARHSMSSRALTTGITCLTVISVLFSIGLIAQDEIDGRPVLDLSDTGHAIEDFNRLADAFEVVSNINTAVVKDPVLIRANAHGAELLVEQADDLAAQLRAQAPRAEFTALNDVTADALVRAAIAMRAASEAAEQTQMGRSEVADRAAEELRAAVEVAIVEFSTTADTFSFPVRQWMEVAS